ncbi:MAG: aromatic amino acid transport family protein [Patescibacteria group bacterium]|jgi:amino acid permease
MKQYFLALATFCGTIIGVGIFGLPYAAAQFGFLPTLFYFAVLVCLTITIHLIFGEICLRTAGNHRLPGLTEIYFGKKMKFLPVISNSIGLFGASLAYIIIGSGFLADLLMPIFGANQLAYVLVFFGLGAFIVFLGSQAISRSDLINLSLFFAILIFLLIKSLPHIQLNNLITYQLSNFFLPYGVILFALSGMSIIPEVKEILGAKTSSLKKIIITGTLLPAAAYLIFIFFVLGVCGRETTPDALTGLKSVLGEKILIAGFIFGILATFTSYINVGLTIKKIFWYDLKFSHFSAWVLATFVPLLLYFIGLKDFILIISFTGAVTMGVDGILVFLVHRKAKKTGQLKPAYQINLPKIVTYLIIAMFLAGVVVELIKI